MKHRNTFLTFIAWIVLSTMPVLADSSYISAPEAETAVSEGNMILIDIRSPEEWGETGVAQGVTCAPSSLQP